ncbi:hypothetical protein CGLO_06901 [Colletotrichum gloeosporioides Cg-14]|uniref:Uncharacterized protein n=1 Tax=Colletotrichum gloeosporioides (strain Cg-14) TaxID=1237896 RepID=T0KD54_COLGC|nr:hypothetical protein CGLO_06901 [Colletotrichum gloeosporioides Cg-14]
MADRRGWAHSASASKSSDNTRETSRSEATAAVGIEASQPILRSSYTTSAPSTSESTAKVTPATAYSRNAVSSANHNQVDGQNTSATDSAPLNTIARKEAGIDNLAGTKSAGEIHRSNDKQNANDLQKATRLPYSGQLAEDTVDVSTPWDAHGTPTRFKMVIR